MRWLVRSAVAAAIFAAAYGQTVKTFLWGRHYLGTSATKSATMLLLSAYGKCRKSKIPRYLFSTGVLCFVASIRTVTHKQPSICERNCAGTGALKEACVAVVGPVVPVVLVFVGLVIVFDPRPVIVASAKFRLALQLAISAQATSSSNLKCPVL